MSQQNMATVTNELIATYGNTAKNLITVYRAGNERAMDVVDRSFLNAMELAGPRLSLQTRSNVVSAEKKITSYYVKSVAVTTENATLLVDKAVDMAARGVHQVAANTERFEKNTGIKPLSTLAVAAVPATLAVTRVAARIEAQSSALASRLAPPAAKRAATSSAKRTVSKKKVIVKKAVVVNKKSTSSVDTPVASV